MKVAEVMRKWDLPGDHPESWIQEDATYRMIWERAIATEREACAKVAEDEHQQGAIDVSSLEFHYGKQIAAAIRARKP